MGRDAHRIIAAYQKRCWNMDRPIHRGNVRGTARGVDRDGALLVKTDAGMRRVLF
jgi:biotin-(acetyl-CoA carboxylase) ligase